MKKQNGIFQKLMMVCVMVSILGYSGVAQAGDDDGAEYDPTFSNTMKMTGTGLTLSSGTLAGTAYGAKKFFFEQAKHFSHQELGEKALKAGLRSATAGQFVGRFLTVTATGLGMYGLGVAAEGGDGSEDGPVVANETEKPHRPVAAAVPAPASGATAPNGTQLK